jgi:hypothetical protein
VEEQQCARSGQVLPKRISRAIRRATIMYSASARSTRPICDSCVASLFLVYLISPYFFPLTFMNIHLHHVIATITGATGVGFAARA